MRLTYLSYILLWSHRSENNEVYCFSVKFLDRIYLLMIFSDEFSVFELSDEGSSVIASSSLLFPLKSEVGAHINWFNELFDVSFKKI